LIPSNENFVNTHKVIQKIAWEIGVIKWVPRGLRMRRQVGTLVAEKCHVSFKLSIAKVNTGQSMEIGIMSQFFRVKICSGVNLTLALCRSRSRSKSRSISRRGL